MTLYLMLYFLGCIDRVEATISQKLKIGKLIFSIAHFFGPKAKLGPFFRRGGGSLHVVNEE